MTGIHPAVAPTGAAPRGLARTLMRIARAAIVALTIVLVIIAIPADAKRQHTVSLAGVEVGIDDAGEVVITHVAAGTPAAEAGMLPGDILVAIDGQTLEKNPAADPLLGAISGRPGTKVALTLRTGDAVPRSMDVTRSPEPGSIAERLATMGIGMDAIIGYMIFLDVLVLLVYLAVSLILIMRGRGTVLTSFASVALVTFGAAATNSMQALALEPSIWGRLAAALVPAGFAAAFTFLGFLYPNGRWVPRRGRILAGIVGIWTIAQWFWPAARPANWAPVLGLLVYLSMIVAMFGAQLHRYRRVATPAEREQIKWFVMALAAVLVGYALSQAAALAIGALGGRPAGASPVAVFVLWQISMLGYQVPYALLAVAIGTALLKHRLWDVDIVINRSVVYSTVTALLAVMSTIILAVMTRLIGGLLGKNSPLLAVALTAAFPVAMFNPLRARIQRLVDRKMKPEEVSFDETSDLLTLEVRALLGPGELLKTLVVAVAGQLDLASAAAYTPEPGGRLVLARETPPLPGGSGSPSELTVDDAARGDLAGGGVVAPPEGSGFSLFVPLTTARTRTHEMCGVLALGPRQNGRGYTTPLVHGLQKLGVEAGKALYVARLRESNRVDTEDRLERIERLIASLKP